MYQCLNRAIPSRKGSIKAPTKWRHSVYVLTEICYQRSKWLGPRYFFMWFQICIVRHPLLLVLLVVYSDPFLKEKWFTLTLIYLKEYNGIFFYLGIFCHSLNDIHPGMFHYNFQPDPNKISLFDLLSVIIFIVYIFWFEKKSLTCFILILFVK